MGCSLQKKIRNLPRRTDLPLIAWVKLADVDEELGVVAQKIREIFEQAKDSLTYDEETEHYFRVLEKEVLGLLVENSKEQGK